MKDKNKPLVEMSHSEFTAAFDELSMDNSVAMLENARKGEPRSQDGLIACAMLRLSDGSGAERIAFQSDEYWDGEGTRLVDEFIDEVMRCGLLLPGESIRRVVYRPTAKEEVGAADLAIVEAGIQRMKEVLGG